MRVFCSAVRLAPRRTTSLWRFSTRRSCSDFRPSSLRLSWMLLMRANSFSLKYTLSSSAWSLGSSSLLSAWISGVLRLPFITENIRAARSSALPERSIATKVFSKVGDSLLAAICSISARSISPARSIAGPKSEASTLSHGGLPPSGPVHSASKASYGAGAGLTGGATDAVGVGAGVGGGADGVGAGGAAQAAIAANTKQAVERIFMGETPCGGGVVDGGGLGGAYRAS